MVSSLVRVKMNNTTPLPTSIKIPFICKVYYPHALNVALDNGKLKAPLITKKSTKFNANHKLLFELMI